METKEVFIEGIKYRSEENGYTVMMAMEGREELFVVGYCNRDLSGETLRISGQMRFHPSYGPQFYMQEYEQIMPTDIDSIRRYLSSGVIKGIGAVMTERLLSAFGTDVLRIMEQEPERLAEIKGISLRKAQELGIQVEEKSRAREAMMFLQQYGLSNRMSVKIMDYYGDEMMNRLSEDPYCLVEDIEGIGFKTADEIALQMGILKTAEHRVHCGIRYVLQQTLLEGNTYLPTEELLVSAAELLGIERSNVEEAVSDMALEKKLHIRDDCVFDQGVYLAEQRCAKALTDHNWVSSESEEEIRRIIEKVGAGDDLTFDPLQTEAVIRGVRHGVFILTGGPGTGKTTTLNTMIRVFLHLGRDLVLAAPTGRAAKRMSEATGYEAKTIHRLLEVKAGVDSRRPSFERNEDNPLEADVIIVDEMSMVDLFLFQALLRALPPEANLIMVGDPNQLPSVGPGQVLADLLGSGLFENVELERIYRQKQESRIVVGAHMIRKGEMIPLQEKSEDFVFLPRDNARDIQRDILTLVTKQLPSHFHVRPDQIQVLTPMKKGMLGVGEMNLLLQRFLNPPEDGKAEKEFGDKLFRIGDKVMQTKNDYQMHWQIRGYNRILLEEGDGVFNGDVGVIQAIDEQDRSVEVLFDDGKCALYGFDQVGDLELAYAMTIHKSQGSEYPVVILPLLGVPFQMIYRNLLYTAITRAQQCVLILGSAEVVASMIGSREKKRRYTGLAQRLEEMAYEEK